MRGISTRDTFATTALRPVRIDRLENQTGVTR
jgi:hypothetical protein